MRREYMKMLIELSSTLEEADKIISDAGFETVGEKMAFLKGMFDFELIGRFDDASIKEDEAKEMDYYAALNAIIKGIRES